MPIGRKMRTKWGVEDAARRTPMLNIPKNVRRDMTHLGKSTQVRCSGVPVSAVYWSFVNRAEAGGTRALGHRSVAATIDRSVICRRAAQTKGSLHGVLLLPDAL